MFVDYIRKSIVNFINMLIILERVSSTSLTSIFSFLYIFLTPNASLYVY